ncbi:MAG TPA: HutD family protein [Rhizomicrobium sp.]|nr:HutD family protein [Rhizomicrobium sp.]
MKILRASERVRTLWKNGGGTTTEVAVHPPGAGFDDFGWRVSIADVRQGGPFSQFPGIDRCLAVLDGEMALKIADRTPVVVSPDTPSALFSGDDRTDATLIGGAVVDLNVMTRRSAFTAKVAKHKLTAASAFKATTTTIGLVLNPLAVRTDHLDARDAVLVEPGEEIAFPSGSHLYWIEIFAQNR